MMLLSVMSLLLPMFSLSLASAVADLPVVAVVYVLLLLALLLMVMSQCGDVAAIGPAVADILTQILLV
jgi:hypothetical protein